MVRGMSRALAGSWTTLPGGGYTFGHGIGTITYDVMLVCVMNLIDDAGPGLLGLHIGTGASRVGFVHIPIDNDTIN
jgi:hypothetical protein